MSKIKWLHISDLHFDGALAKDPYDQNKILSPLLNIAEKKKPDLIFVTGDIGKSGKKEDYEPAIEFFDRILKKTNLNHDRLWIVPGNHDVNRRAKAGRILESELDSQAFFGDPDARKPFIIKFNSYIECFLKQLFKERKLADCDAVHNPAVIVIKRFPIGILPLNSAWFSQDEKDQNQLWVGVRTIKDRVHQLETNEIKPKLIIGILHHPFGCFHQNEAARSYIRQKCNIVLRGHLHNENIEFVSNPDGKLLEVTGGATYLGSNKKCRVFFATFDTVTRKVIFEPLEYQESTASNWVPVSLFPEPPHTSIEFPIPEIKVVPPSSRVVFPPKLNTLNKPGWMESIIEGFVQSYNNNAEKSMALLLDHIFEIIKKFPNDPHIHQRIKDLGKALYNDTNLRNIKEHHLNIFKLLELGIQQDLPHLFMLPQVEKKSLIEVPQYSQLILASRYLSAGYCEKARELTKPIVTGCFIASYIYSQSARKMEIFGEAKTNLESNIEELEGFYKETCFYRQLCSYTHNLKFNCNYDFILAENYRALGVVFRKIGKKEEAKINFEKATIAAISAIKSEKSNSSSSQHNSEILSGTYEMMPSRVLADIYYSHGYFLYEENNFQDAAILFDNSIKTLKKINEKWDAPYIRLAIIRLSSNDVKEREDSFDLFSKGREICVHTASTKNRESSLGLALCTLGLRIIEIMDRKISINYDATEELKAAFQLEPPLSIGALKCHLHDAENLKEIVAKNHNNKDFTIVNNFIDLLNEEIKITTNKSPKCRSTTC